MFISSTLGNRSCSAAINISDPSSSIEYDEWSGCCNFMTFRSTNDSKDLRFPLEEHFNLGFHSDKISCYCAIFREQSCISGIWQQRFVDMGRLNNMNDNMNSVCQL
ncbi:uncharacterized protein LOC122574022 isoform X5 [Bombus pyrosoma]|uniref:uncharacterized protein LOC122574022 isoform X5 n=1 Tax=Bombus pyrosoma TaxID=396416 RepID=UPI001CB8F925|nr:uncharacterized protein LOC122574022 isoform X5 [Bombus pyrosoma]